ELDAALRGAPPPAPALGDAARDLRQRLETWMRSPDAGAARAALHERLAALADSGAGKIPLIAAELDRLVELVAEDPSSLTEDVRATLLASCDALAAEFGRAGTGPADAPAPLAPPA